MAPSESEWSRRRPSPGGGVANAGGGILLEFLPSEVVVGLDEPLLIGDGIGKARPRHGRCARKHDHLFDGLQGRGELFDQRQEGDVGESRRSEA